jgi:hypothetical protein
MQDSLAKQHFQLLQDTLFTSVKDEKDFLIVESFLTDAVWNLIVPKISAEKINFDSLQEFIKGKKKERDFSLYIHEDLNNSYSNTLELRGWENSFTDIYIYKELKEKFTVELKNDEEFRQVDGETYAEYVEQAKLSFPEYENEVEYTKNFYNFGYKKEEKELRNFLIKNDKEIICFQSVIYSKKLNLAYLHNGGTNENYRRQGYFTKLNKLMYNYLLEKRITKIYGLVEESGNSHKASKNFGFTTNSKYYGYSEI